jgi:hypothetical protein
VGEGGREAALARVNLVCCFGDVTQGGIRARAWSEYARERVRSGFEKERVYHESKCPCTLCHLAPFECDRERD